MMEIAKLPDDDRSELFRNTAARTGLNDAIVEKDFWVCLTLDYLFQRSPWRKQLTFKGGTSLSKGYHLISRFSEDIDLILDWRVLGYGLNEPWEKRSNTKQDAFNKEANRPEYLVMPQRYSRHYYDLYCMSAGHVKDKAFARVDLLRKVVDFKMKFYPRTWARYQEAVPSTLRLAPPEYRLSALKADYTAMRNMLYGEVPSFEHVMEIIRKLENEIHTL